MRRREFITLFGGAAAVWPLAARAQQPERMRRIGILLSDDRCPIAIGVCLASQQRAAIKKHL